MTLTLSSSLKATERGEPELVDAARAGDDRAFEQLYARYRQRIFSFILGRVHDHGRAEDIAQDVFISALRRLRGTNGRIAFKPWIYEIAKNACIDEFRRGARSREIPLEAGGELITDRHTRGQAPTPAAAVEGKQRLDDLRGAFGGLSANHHKLLVMREFEGLTYDEIGTRLGMTRPMVESGLFRARRKLTQEYQELASGRRCEQVQDAIDDGRLTCARGLGLRDRRRFARHLAHCQPCRHVALQVGVDAALVQPRGVAAKIAAFLPFPFLRRLLTGRMAGMHHPTMSAVGGRAAAAIAAAALAGAGGGVVHVLNGGGGPSHPAPGAARLASATTGGGVAMGGAGFQQLVVHRAAVAARVAPPSPARPAHAVHRAALHLTTGSRHSGARIGRHRSAPAPTTGRRAQAPGAAPAPPVTTVPVTAAVSPSGGLPTAAARIPSLASAIGQTIANAVGPGTGSAQAIRQIGQSIGSDPLKAAGAVASGLTQTLASGVLGGAPPSTSETPGGGRPGGSSADGSTSSTAAINGVVKPVSQLGSGMLGH